MNLATLALLATGVTGVVMRPFSLPAWAAPTGAALLAVALGLTDAEAALRALEPLREPIAFLLAAVPLAVMLDQLGFFAALAERLTGAGHGSGALWVLAAATTTVLNLDASVVLLTPLYVGVARHTGRDPLTLAFQPVLLACLASSALPVSNLTNLIAAEQTGAGSGDFLAHLALPSLVATTLGWVLYERRLRPDQRGPDRADATDERPNREVGGAAGTRPLRDAERHPRALAIGAAVCAGLLAGFVVGPAVGAAPWMVALAGDAVLVAVVRRAPWPHVPLATAATVGALAVLAATAVGGIEVDRLIGGGDPAGLGRTAAVAALAANLVNNLPALLVALPAVGDRPGPALWATLIGVNMGPVVLVTGSLASLLWLDALHRLGVEVHPRDFTRVGLQVGLPAAAAGVATLVVLDGLV